MSASLPSCAPRNEFVRLLGHEIRNHLAPIQNALHVLRLRGRTDPALSPVLDIIERQVSGITRTLDSISEAERASRGDVPLVRAPFAVEPWLREVVASIRDAAPEARPAVEVTFDDPVLQIDADRERLARAVALVLENALRHGAADAPVTVRGRREGDDLVIEIADQGSGLPPELIPHAFEFMAAREWQGRGIGLGLPLAQRIVAAHGGAMQLDSGAHGTRVRLRIPPGRAGDATTHSPEPAARSERRAAGEPPAARRVLIADDSAALRASLVDLLQEMGHEVEAAADGVEAVERALAWRPDFVLIDIHMPKLNGFDVARRLRAAFPPGAMRLVMLSGNDLDEVVVRGAREAGFDEWIDKGRAIDALEALLGSGAARGA